MFNVVCYLGGTAGDLIVAMIDKHDATINNSMVHLDPNRQRLKKSWQFCDDHKRNQYVSQISKQYKSIPSHDVEYHLRNGHSFIAITVDKWATAKWASLRFKELHRPKIWAEMQSVNSANTVEKYAQDILDWSAWIKQYTNRIIRLEDILDGRVYDNISSIITVDPDGIDFYNQWLQVQNENSNNSNQGRG